MLSRFASVQTLVGFLTALTSVLTNLVLSIVDRRLDRTLYVIAKFRRCRLHESTREVPLERLRAMEQDFLAITDINRHVVTFKQACMLYFTLSQMLFRYGDELDQVDISLNLYGALEEMFKQR